MATYWKKFPIGQLEEGVREFETIFPPLRRAIGYAWGASLTSEHPMDFMVLQALIVTLAERSINEEIPELLTNALPHKVTYLFFPDDAEMDWEAGGGSNPIAGVEWRKLPDSWRLEKWGNQDLWTEKAQELGWQITEE